jgi:phenylacetate-coenzyme A ligase PaaK-like adenylate-forming protein
MFETGVRQIRLAVGMVTGRRISTSNLARLVDDAVATIIEFGEPGTDAQALLGGPLPDPGEQLEFANRALRRTARRLAKRSPFYGRRFAGTETEPAGIDVATLRAIPVTTKRDLIERSADFQCTDVERYLSTRTTGTTGRPAEIWLSRYEVDLWSGFSALASIIRDELRTTDIMQVNVSSRAVAATHLTAATCRLAQTGCRLLGVLPPDDAIDSLGDGEVTLLSTYPSYLAELVDAARRRGLTADDFNLRRITVGGEVLSPSVAEAARRTFGVTRIEDIFSMTEVIPISGRNCDQGHLHIDPTSGHVELLDLVTGEPAAPGALGTVVITPYFPYRDCMPVFRYDTRDIARCLPEKALTCELSGIPAISPILGKASSLLETSSGAVITPSQLVCAIESLPTEPWPARFQASVTDGRLTVALPASALAGYGEAAAVRHLAEAGLDADLRIVPDEAAASLRRTRSDLHETSFAVSPALVGA